MKIIDVEAIILQAKNDYATPTDEKEANGVKYCMLLKVTTDEGIVGWSDVETSPHVAAAAVNAPSTGMRMMEGFRHLLIGEDPFDVEKIWDKLYQGTIYYGRRGVAMQLMSGFDIAFHDIIGKAIGRPVCQLLGGARRDRIKAYASTLFRPTPDGMKFACEHYLERGFKAVKFGWGGFGEDRKNDRERVAAARQILGPDVTLMIDAGWHLHRSARNVVDTIRDIECFDIFWYEDFLPPDCYDGYARVKDSGVTVRLAAGEQEATAFGFRDLIERGRVDIVQPDLSRCGGFSQIRRISWEADRAGIDVCPHAWLTDLLTAASLHVNAWLPRSLYLEYNVSANPMLREIIQNPITLEADGTLRVPDAPGLGIEIDESAIARYRVA